MRQVIGILVGGFLDLVTSAILGIPLMIYVIVTSHLPRTSPKQLGQAVAAAIHARPSVYAVQLLIGFVCTVFGAYVAAWIARRAEILSGVLSSLVCVAVSVYSIVSGKDQGGPLSHLLLFGLTLAAGVLGGYLRSRKRVARA